MTDAAVTQAIGLPQRAFRTAVVLPSQLRAFVVNPSLTLLANDASISLA